MSRMNLIAALAALTAAAGAQAPGASAALASFNPDWPTGVAFAGTPPAAHPRPGSACEVAQQYVTFIASDRAPQVPGLFAEDGAFIGVADRVFRGPAEIAAFYNTVHQGGAIPLSFIDAGPNCIMELAGRRLNPQAGQPEQYRLLAIDHFTIGADRKIKRLVIFFRPGAMSRDASAAPH